MSNNQYRSRGPSNGYEEEYGRTDQRRPGPQVEVPPAPYYPQQQQNVRYRSAAPDQQQPISDQSRYRVHDAEKATTTEKKPSALPHPVPVLRLVIDMFLVAIGFIPIILLNTISQPYQRGFYCDDDSIRYPYKFDTITNIQLYSVGAAIVFVTIVIVECMIAFTKPTRNGRYVFYSIRGKVLHPLLSSIYVYLGFCVIGFLFVQILTDICKQMVGRLRPHFLDVCDPDWSMINCTGHSYIVDPHCQTDNKRLLRDARVSFLSGHSSYSSYMMFYLIIYLQFRWHWPSCSLVAKYFLQFAFAMLSLYTGLTRISDHKHHWNDVGFGFFVGITIACLTALHIAKFPKREARARIENEFEEPGEHTSFVAKYKSNEIGTSMAY